MAKKAAKQAMTAGTEVASPSYKPPPPEVRFDLDDGVLATLPSVGKSVTLQVSGRLAKVAEKEYSGRDCMTIRQPKVKLIKSTKGEKA